MSTPTWNTNDGFITREDAALKRKLQGIRVPVSVEQRAEDPDGGMDEDHGDGPLIPDTKFRVVPVYFRLPENEVRRKTYPYITIDFLSATRDIEREHRGVHTYGLDGDTYQPAGLTPGLPSVMELPIPMQLQYQVTTFARYNQHDRIITTQLLFSRLEPRFGGLEMVATDMGPDDNTVRRLDLLSGPTNLDTRDSEGKRLFRKSYTVGVSSELFRGDFRQLARASRVVLDVRELDSLGNDPV